MVGAYRDDPKIVFQVHLCEQLLKVKLPSSIPQSPASCLPNLSDLTALQKNNDPVLSFLGTILDFD